MRGKVTGEVKRLSTEHGITPGLAVVLVGNNPASQSYVGSKAKVTVETGMRSFDHRLPESVGEDELLALVRRLNADPAVHGILVQLPLPPQIDAQKVLAAIDPGKDVDGFHPVNAGTAGVGAAGAGALHAARLHASREDGACRRWQGLEAVVIGRSNIVGKPLAQLAAGRERDRHRRPIPGRATCRRCAVAPTSCSQRSAAPRWCAATGSSRARP